jgi:hypothetical protein
VIAAGLGEVAQRAPGVGLEDRVLVREDAGRPEVAAERQIEREEEKEEQEGPPGVSSAVIP